MSVRIFNTPYDAIYNIVTKGAGESELSRSKGDQYNLIVRLVR